MLHPSLNNSPLAAARLREHRAFLIPQFERESWRGDFALEHFPKDFELRLPASEKEERRQIGPKGLLSLSANASSFSASTLSASMHTLHLLPSIM